ncbi:MAG: YaiI/YqxD family protein, partial [Nitrospina sp.]|nr:YaiI/YqxD family protein [Nitrospina sp.]
MKIWVDADACPRPVKEILFRVADRTEITVTLVTNQGLRIPSSAFIH